MNYAAFLTSLDRELFGVRAVSKINALKLITIPEFGSAPFRESYAVEV